MRCLAHIVGINAIANRTNERDSLATMLDLQLMHTENPTPHTARDVEASGSRFVPTQRHFALCLTHDSVSRDYEVCGRTTPIDFQISLPLASIDRQLGHGVARWNSLRSLSARRGEQ